MQKGLGVSHGIIDGIVGGEGEGPLDATPVQAGLLVGGQDPGLVDWVASRAMGLEPGRIAMIGEALDGKLLATGREENLESLLDGPSPDRTFRAPSSWPSLSDL